MTQTMWPQSAQYQWAPTPLTPEDIVAHLVADHGWAPQHVSPAVIHAHRYAHGVEGHPELTDPVLNHAHLFPRGGGRSLTWTRVLTGAIVAWNALMALWLAYAVVVTGQGVAKCEVEAYADACATGATIGGGVAIIAILFVTALVDVILAVIWHVTKK